MTLSPRGWGRVHPGGVQRPGGLIRSHLHVLTGTAGASGPLAFSRGPPNPVTINSLIRGPMGVPSRSHLDCGVRDRPLRPTMLRTEGLDLWRKAVLLDPNSTHAALGPRSLCVPVLAGAVTLTATAAWGCCSPCPALPLPSWGHCRAAAPLLHPQTLGSPGDPWAQAATPSCDCSRQLFQQSLECSTATRHTFSFDSRVPDMASTGCWGLGSTELVLWASLHSERLALSGVLGSHRLLGLPASHSHCSPSASVCRTNVPAWTLWSHDEWTSG